jgi:acetylornithine deacetylase
MLEQVTSIIEENREKYIEQLGNLVRWYPEGEEEFQQRIANRLDELGCEVHLKKLLPVDVQLKREFAVAEAIDISDRTHVIGIYKGIGGGRSLMLITHPDGDPIKTDTWEKEPHTGQIIGNKMYGWAVADDSAGICMMTEAVGALMQAGYKPKGDIYLMSASAKRNAWGIAALLLDGYRADATLYLHPSESELGMKEVKTLTSGLLKFRIKVKGMRPPKTEFVQVTFHHLGVNPIDKAIYVIEEMKKFDKTRRKRIIYPPLNDYIGRGTQLLNTYFESGKKDNLTDMPSDCTIGFGLTFPPPEDIDDTVKEVEAEIKRISESDPWLKENPLEIEWIQGTQGVEVSVDHPVVVTVMDAIEDVTGVRPFSNPLYSKSDVRTPMLIAEIPNVGYGPLAGDLSTTGGKDEWVDLDDYIEAIKVTARIIVNWCGLGA